MKLQHLAVCALMFGCGAAQALTLDFNAQADNQYWIGSTSSQGYTEVGKNNGSGDIGLVSRVDGFGNTNGTVSLISWNNDGATSGFSLSKSNASAFSLLSFDFANGYPNFNSAVSSIDVIGTLSGGGSVSQHFASTWGSTNFVNLTFNSAFSNLLTVDFIANGSQNRAIWDNIVVGEANKIPEPTSMALFGLGLAALTYRRRKAL